jgi:hypothetical protein
MLEWRYGSTLLALGTRWRWVLSFMSPIYSQELGPGIQSIGGWVGPRAALAVVDNKNKISSPSWESNSSRPAHNPSLNKSEHACIIENDYCLLSQALSNVSRSCVMRGRTSSLSTRKSRNWKFCLKKRIFCIIKVQALWRWKTWQTFSFKRWWLSFCA